MGTPRYTCVALIPARCGSVRVKDKNIRRFGDHPLLAYTIAAARDSSVFNAIIVSTDSNHYAEIARYYGAEVPFLRPAELATSTSPDYEFVCYTLEALDDVGRQYDCFSILRPTSPFRQADTIRRAWQAFHHEVGVDSLRAVERCRQHPGKMWVVRGNRMLPLMPLGPAEKPWHSSQTNTLPEIYVQNASLEIAWTRVIFEDRTIAGSVVMPFLTQDSEGIDINDEKDWLYAQHLLRTGAAKPPEVSIKPFEL
jgi:CMP-N,N'-diacetyllegionaminic acid synthase